MEETRKPALSKFTIIFIIIVLVLTLYILVKPSTKAKESDYISNPSESEKQLANPPVNPSRFARVRDNEEKRIKQRMKEVNDILKEEKTKKDSQ
ncbi:MAG: hypothetical protein JXA60_03815 [Candidatus Coatesbacteria bacterium]|nr:hypothetical protein [Candidatus Coatesbacteria bacterium]